MTEPLRPAPDRRARPDPAQVLAATAISARIDDLFAEIAVTHTYRNPGARPVEAICTFPLPHDATLLSLEVEIGGERLAGRVIPARAAEDRYEDAVAGGDAAVLLETAGPGLCTASLGNLKPGETALLRYRYAVLLRWNGDAVRLSLPTTVAPRYGRPRGLDPHQLPETALAAEHRFTFSATIRGVLRAAEVSSPGHRLIAARRAGALEAHLAGPAAMDRDFVLEAQLPGAVTAGTSLGRDGDGWVALASFRPDLPDTAPRHDGTLTIVIDCSGSMNGAAMAQARAGLVRIVESLPDGARFDVVAFGSAERALFGTPRAATERTRAMARAFAESLRADLGGTELGRALRAVVRGAGDAAPRDVFLITDGQVWEAEAIAAQARATGHRIFTVGVGHAAVEGTLRVLAEATGGAAEAVTPEEDMAARIHRHFRRLLSPAAQEAHIRWPGTPRRTWPTVVGPVFDGDTLHAFAWYDEKPQGAAVLEHRLGGGATLRETAPVSGPAQPAEPETGAAPLARLAAARRLAADPEMADAEVLALRYRLITPATRCVVVHERARDDRAEDLPDTIKVPQTLPATTAPRAGGARAPGSGAAAIRLRYATGDGPSYSRRSRLIYDASSPHRKPGPKFKTFLEPLEGDATSGANREGAERRSEAGLARFLDALTALDAGQVPSIARMRRWGLPEGIAADLDALVAEGNAEETVVLSFLALLRSGTRHRPGRWVRFRIARMCRRRGVDRRLVEGRVTLP